jgi:hypothetical protein
VFPFMILTVPVIVIILLICTGEAVAILFPSPICIVPLRRVVDASTPI